MNEQLISKSRSFAKELREENYHKIVFFLANELHLFSFCDIKKLIY